MFVVLGSDIWEWRRSMKTMEAFGERVAYAPYSVDIAVRMEECIWKLDDTRGYDGEANHLWLRRFEMM